MAQTQTDLGRKPIGRLLIQLAVPSITAQIVNMLYNLVDRIYIGHIPGIGATALTGVGVTFPIIMLIAAFSSLIGMGGAPLASIKMGEDDYDGAEHIMGNCLTMLIGISIGMTAFFLAFNEPLLMLFGASEQTISYALDYLNIYVLGTAFVQLALGMNAFISSQGFAKTSMLTVLIGAVTNIALDPIFIYTFGMGVEGAALASVISQGLSTVWVLWFLCGKKTRLKIRKKYMKVSLSILMPTLALGVSPFIMQSTESILNIVLNASLARYGGDNAVGAMAILASLMQILLLPLTGLCQGGQPIIGYNYGAGNTHRVKQTFWRVFWCSLAYSTVYWAIAMLFPETLASLFTKDPALLETTAWAIRIYLAAGFVMGAQIACQQTFIAVGQAKSSLFLALLRKVFLLIPLIYLFPLFFSDKVYAVFFAEPVADILATSITVVVFFTQIKKILRRREQERQGEQKSPAVQGE